MAKENVDVVRRSFEAFNARDADEIDDDWESFQIDPVEFHDHGERVAVIGQVRALGSASSVNVDSVAGFVFELRRAQISHITSYSDPQAALDALGEPE